VSRKIYLDAPNVGALEKKYLNKAIDTGYVSTVGPFVAEFERRFARHLGVKKAVSTQSGTAALHVALRELGIGKSDEVIVPALTFVATVNPVVYAGARPVFADVDAKTWNIDPAEIEKKITKKTKAIIPVHLYGNPCDMSAIMKIASEHGLYVVEDATESLGTKYKGRYTGTFGDMGCFSFNGNKIITTGGGGMVVGRESARADHVKFLVNQARDEEQGYYHPEIGFNYRMTNIESALGLAQMQKLNTFLRKKEMFNRVYRQMLSGIDCIHFQEGLETAPNPFWLTAVSFSKPLNIGVVQEGLKRHGVPVRRVFMPMTEFPPYKSARKYFVNSYQIYERSLCFPSSTLNSEQDIRYVCKVVKDVILKNMGTRVFI